MVVALAVVTLWFAWLDKLVAWNASTSLGEVRNVLLGITASDVGSSWEDLSLHGAEISRNANKIVVVDNLDHNLSTSEFCTELSSGDQNRLAVKVAVITAIVLATLTIPYPLKRGDFLRTTIRVKMQKADAHRGQVPISKVVGNSIEKDRAKGTAIVLIVCTENHFRIEGIVNNSWKFALGVPQKRRLAGIKDREFLRRIITLLAATFSSSTATTTFGRSRRRRLGILPAFARMLG